MFYNKGQYSRYSLKYFLDIPKCSIFYIGSFKNKSTESFLLKYQLELDISRKVYAS